jgi:hypothetical protein
MNDDPRDHFDPDRWIDSGRELKDFGPLSSPEATLFYSNHPTLWKQVQRWWNMVVQVSIRAAEYDDVDRLKEEDLREMWQAVKRITVR